MTRKRFPSRLAMATAGTMAFDLETHMADGECLSMALLASNWPRQRGLFFCVTQIKKPQISVALKWVRVLTYCFPKNNNDLEISL